MARRRRSLGEEMLDDLFDLLMVLPWWGAVIVALLFYGLLQWLLPSVLLAAQPENPGLRMLPSTFARFSVAAAPYVAIVVLLLGGIAAIKRRERRQRLDQLSGHAGLDNLSWSEFEALLAEGFQREGYMVVEQGGAEPDGGVDLRLQRGGKEYLVQAKHWKARAVGVKVVRELLGVVSQQFANGGIVVTSKDFTVEAKTFAKGTNIRLINGEELLQMIRRVQREPRPLPQPAGIAQQATTAPYCPKCNATMMLRTARQGPRVGERFWGCSAFPRCKGTLPMAQ